MFVRFKNPHTGEYYDIDAGDVFDRASRKNASEHVNDRTIHRSDAEFEALISDIASQFVDARISEFTAAADSLKAAVAAFKVQLDGFSDRYAELSAEIEDLSAKAVRLGSRVADAD